jgi:hypothetical protein
MMMMMSNLRDVCAAKKRQKRRGSAFGGSLCKEGQMQQDANGETDAQ